MLLPNQYECKKNDHWEYWSWSIFAAFPILHDFAAAVLAVDLVPVNVLFAMMCQLVCCNDRDRLFTRIKIDLTTYYQPAHQNPAFVCFSPPLCQNSAATAVAAVNAFAPS